MKTAQSLTRMFLLTAVLLAFSANALGQAEAPAVRPAQQGSLERVPQTAGYYFSTMNHQALLERLFKSNAWANLKSTDVSKGMKKAYRRGKTRGYAEYNEENPFAVYLKGYGDTVGSVVFQSVWQIAREVVNNELFIYVDNDAITFNRAVSKFQLAVIDAMPNGGFGDDQPSKEAFIGTMAELFSENFADVECPTMIMGARLDEPEEFQGLLELLQSLAEQGMKTIPKDFRWIKKWWNVVDQDGHYLMAIDVRLSDVPLDELLKDLENPQLEKLIETVGNAKKVSIALGIVDDLLMLGVASDKEKLINFGNGPLLIDTPFAGKLRAAKENGDTIVGVAYMSKEVAQSMTSMQQASNTWQYYIKAIVKALDVDGELDREQVAQDATALIEDFFTDMRSLLPDPGAMIAFSSLQDDGIRMSAMSQTKWKTLDASKPLDLANHVGPDTVAFMAQRSSILTKQYEFVAKWSSKAFDLFQRLGKDKFIEGMVQSFENNPEDLDGTPEENATRLVENMLDRVQRVFTKFDTVTRKRLCPAIEGQEMGMFVDMVRGPESWCKDMEPSADPLALPLPALMIGHSDSKKLIEAGARYMDVINEGIRSTRDTIKEFASADDSDDAPFKLPVPERLEDGDDVSFRWNMLVDHLRADESLRTGTRVSENWLVMNFHDGQAKRLTEASGQNGLFGPAKTDQPSAILAFMDNRVLMDSARQWVDYGASLADENPLDLSQYDAERDTLQFTEAQMSEAVDSVWAIAECFKGISLRSWEVPEGTATEILLKFEDVGP